MLSSTKARQGAVPFVLGAFLVCAALVLGYPGAAEAATTLIELPNGDAGPNQGSPVPTGAHYLTVDDDPHDGDTSVLRFAGAGQREVFTVADQLRDDDHVTSVKVRWVAKKGSGTNWQARAGLVLDGVEFFGPTVNLSTDYAIREASFVNNPATSLPWTVQQVRAAMLIYQQVTITMQLPKARLTEIVLVVTVERCYHATGTFSQDKNPQQIPWSGDCSFFSPSHPSSTHFDYLDYQEAATADDQWQCIQEVVADYILEHYWVFPNLPPGPKYLVAEGHASPNSNETGNFKFLYNTRGPGPLNAPIPDVYIANTPDSDARRSAFIMNNSAAASFYILLSDSVRDPADQQLDQVHIDYLAICEYP